MSDREPESPVPLAVGIDTGGTHTDLVLVGPGFVRTHKVPTTPNDLNDGIVRGLREILETADARPDDLGQFVYATTFVTNLIVEGRERPLGLITTVGFRDVLHIGRASRKPDVYDIHWRPPTPLIARHLRLTVPERMDHTGRVVQPLDEAATIAVLKELAGSGVQSIAVALLHSYANPAHERRVAELARQVCPEIDISLSSEVIREFREYERTSTTVINAFIKRPIQNHLGSLEQRLRETGAKAAPFIMQGNGGICTFESAGRLPVAITHSGVVGGIVGATALAASCGIRNIITLDMGGTSADVAVVQNGRPVLSGRSSVGSHPLLVPTLDMVTIGAGGGSIASVAGGTALRVGPHSAGSVPGPACYGQGGQHATVTDANLLAGRLNPKFFLGGARSLHPQLAEAAMERLAGELGITCDAAALGVIAIAEAHMANAVRLVSVERGLDPRDFTLVAFGGAGALHAVQLAEALSIDRVLVPPAPGNLSAMGLLCADVRHDLMRTRICTLSESDSLEIRVIYESLLQEAQETLEFDRVPSESRHCAMSADLRYHGQNYELNLPISQSDVEGDFAAVAGRFHAQHKHQYGYDLPGRAVQLVNVRLTAVGSRRHASWPRRPAGDAASASLGGRPVLLGSGDWAYAPTLRHDAIPAALELEGPAIVEYRGSTLYLAPSWRATFDEMGNGHLVRTTVTGADASRVANAKSESTHVV